MPPCSVTYKPQLANSSEQFAHGGQSPITLCELFDICDDDEDSSLNCDELEELNRSDDVELCEEVNVCELDELADEVSVCELDVDELTELADIESSELDDD